MEDYIDELIIQAMQDVREAEKRLKMLSSMKKIVSKNSGTLTVKEASRMLAMSERSVRALLRSGKLKGHRVGKSYLVDVDSVKEVLAR